MSKKADAFYFESFAECAEITCEAAALLQQSLANYNAIDLDATLVKMHEIENRGDQKRHQVMHRLVREFIAPIERDDIIKICENIDNVTDSIEDVLLKCFTNNISDMREDCVVFAGIVSKSCGLVKELMDEFPNFRKSKTMMDIIIRINHVEEEGDRLYLKALRHLHTTSDDAREILVWREIYEFLERCCDACEDVADVVEGIAIGNS